MDARRQHRIIYQTKIRMRAPGRDDSVIARVQNLSANGMFVTASDLPDAGTEVQCRLTLGGERRTLRGRVAWVRPASPATPLKSPGAGIEFIELDKRDSELLNRLVDPTDERRQAVDVWFEGMATPIRCHAVVVGDGLRLETRLPFMRVNSEVRVAFSQQTPTEVREGILHGVTLEPSPEDGVPFLRIGVTVPPLDSAIGTIEIAAREALRPEDQKTPLASTMVDPAVVGPGASPQVAFGADRERTHKISLTDPEPPAASLTMTPAPPAATTTPASRPLPVPASGSGARTLITGLVLGAALAGAAMWAWTHRTQLSPPTVSLAVAEPPPSQAAPSKDPTAAPTAAGAVADPGDPSVPVPAAAAADPGAAEVPGPEIVPLLTGETPAGAEAGAAEQPDGMALETSEGRVTFTVALEGKAAGAKELHYGDPGGVGVTLPRARPKGGFGTFTPGAGPVRVMSRRRGSGSLVRFFYDGRAFQGKLAVESEMLRLVLAPR